MNRRPDLCRPTRSRRRGTPARDKTGSGRADSDAAGTRSPPLIIPRVFQVRLGPRLRRLQERVPAEAAVRAHVHAARALRGPVPAGVAGQPEAVRHRAGVRRARRRDDDRGRGVVDAVPRGRRGAAGRARRGRVPRLDGRAGQRPAQRVRLRVRRDIRGGGAARVPGGQTASGAAVAATAAGPAAPAPAPTATGRGRLVQGTCSLVIFRFSPSPLTENPYSTL